MEEAVEQLLIDGHYVEASDFIEKRLQDFRVKSGVLYRWLQDLPESSFSGKPGIQFQDKR